MKVKDAVETCGPMSKEHGYLGHFKKKENLNMGHNTDRSILENTNRGVVTKIPNIYKGELQPDYKSGNSLPEVYDPKKPVRT